MLDMLGARKGASAEQRAGEIVTRRFAQDKKPLPALAQEARALQGQPTKPEMLMDLGGGNVHGLASAAASTPGPAKDRIAAALQGRMEEQGTRLVSDLERGLGVERTDIPSMIDNMVQARKAATAPLYETAYQHGTVDDPAIRQLLHKPSMQKAYARAQQIAAEEGVPLVDISQHPPDVRTIDYIKKGLDDLLDVGHRGGEGGLGPSEVRAITANKHALLDATDALVPDYATARAAHESERKLNKALTAGTEALKQGPDEVRFALAQMGPDGQQMYRRGVLSELAQKVESASDRNDATRALWRTQLMRDRLQAVFPDATSYAHFQQLMRREVRMADTRGAVTVGSRTAPLAAEMGDLAGQRFATDAATGGIKGAARKRVLQWLDLRRQGLVGEVGAKVGDLLTAGADPAGPSLADILARLQAPQPTRPVVGVVRRALPNTRGIARLTAGQVGKQ
ncbi:MAG: hypothetical protein H0U85_03520 [Gemmatimonadales bacterium]|nr:hypothetical protein [Gemmatimonadales bacterium]